MAWHIAVAGAMMGHHAGATHGHSLNFDIVGSLHDCCLGFGDRGLPARPHGHTAQAHHEHTAQAHSTGTQAHRRPMGTQVHHRLHEAGEAGMQ